MRDTKRQIVRCAFYDQTAMEKQFEKMASEGWLIDKISAYFWTYRRVDPTNLHITVTYFPNASEFDPGPKQRLTRAGASKGTNYTLTILLIIVMTLVFLGILTAYILRNGVDDGRTPVDSYEKNGCTFEIYDEPMPLYVEDLMEIGDSTWSRERNKHNETLLLSRSEYRQDHVKGGPEGLKDLAYTVVDVKIPFLYDIVKDAMLNERQDEVHGDVIFIDHYEPIDATIWDASAAYQLHWSDSILDTYLICWENRIVEIKFYWDPTPEQIEIVVEKLKK